jgi:hypothetical protein
LRSLGQPCALYLLDPLPIGNERAIINAPARVPGPVKACGRSVRSRPRYGYALAYASAELQGDRGVALAAAANGYAAEYSVL